ncbi:DUF6527 family protein [Sphingobium subterraneum]|uniref:Uncharacterized protein n=1 Tax=Sphingobium subterraneum TaxID=627688 RepID=A0A841J398_9SPHN|nr:DUF6527 family protein [Sphingobium subterraneum]MBB6125669.1 hypothetical protein [Sphingobium subterraneum]
MIRYTELEHRFVKSFPEPLVPGILYVSMEYGSVAHSCCCGCGAEVVTPLTPTDWNITYDGEAISLHPSVGNWTLPCRSHYVIRRDKVIAAPPWSDAQVAAERQRDRRAKARYFRQADPSAVAQPGPETPAATPSAPRPPASWWQRMLNWWKAT